MLVTSQPRAALPRAFQALLWMRSDTAQPFSILQAVISEDIQGTAALSAPALTAHHLHTFSWISDVPAGLHYTSEKWNSSVDLIIHFDPAPRWYPAYLCATLLSFM